MRPWRDVAAGNSPAADNVIEEKGGVRQVGKQAPEKGDDLAKIDDQDQILPLTGDTAKKIFIFLILGASDSVQFINLLRNLESARLMKNGHKCRFIVDQVVK